MIEKCSMTASEISSMEVLNSVTVNNAIAGISSLRTNRVLVTDTQGLAICDNDPDDSLQGRYCLFPEILQALDGNDVFSWKYHDGVIQSRAATPILSYGTVIGCIYITEVETAQGALIKSLQKNIFMVTLTLEIVVLVYSLIFSKAFTIRLKKIMSSIRIIREGDYSHRVNMGKNDELTVLGNEFDDLVSRLRISEQKRNNFVSDASHELKTPLASIKLLTDSILQNDMDMNTVREFVSDIGNEAERLNRMSQKLLTLSKAESSQETDCEIISILPTMENVIRMLSVLAAENQVQIVTDAPQDCPVLIIEDDLYQILFNLVENGIKYNRKGGTLYLSLKRETDNAILSVSDTGVGIPQESLEHIFERFYRVDKARSRKSGGSGLGLSIVRSLVQRNGGTISASSEEGKGSTFTVTFPIFDMEVES